MSKEKSGSDGHAPINEGYRPSNKIEKGYQPTKNPGFNPQGGHQPEKGHSGNPKPPSHE